jgi:hypothetical protein
MRNTDTNTTYQPQFRAWKLAAFALALMLGGCRRASPGESLRNAAAAGDATQVNQILARDASAVDDPDPRTGMTPLEFAVISGNRSIATTLLTHGAKPNTFDKLGMNPLGHAVRHGNWSIVQLLIDHGARVKGVSFLKARITPLMVAAMEGERSTTEHLLALGADRAARDATGLTAADHARKDGHPELAALLENNPTTRK